MNRRQVLGGAVGAVGAGGAGCVTDDSTSRDVPATATKRTGPPAVGSPDDREDVYGASGDFSGAVAMAEGRTATHPVADVTHPNYGAVGDGETDDHAAIADALAAVQDAGGGTVFIPAGEYRVDGGFPIEGDDVTIHGEGPQSRLLQDDPSARTFHARDRDRLVFRDFAIDGQRGEQTSPENDEVGIGLFNCRHVWIDSLLIENTVSDAIYVNSWEEPETDDRISITNVHAVNNGRQGIANPGSSHVEISGCVVTNSVLSGINYEAGQGHDVDIRGSRIVGNTVVGAGQYGIMVTSQSIDDETNVVIQGNTIRDCHHQGIYGNLWNGMTCIGNSIYNVGTESDQRGEGIYVWQLRSTTIQGNVIDTTGTEGISLVADDRVIVLGNLLRNIGGRSITNEPLDPGNAVEDADREIQSGIYAANVVEDEIDLAGDGHVVGLNLVAE